MTRTAPGVRLRRAAGEDAPAIAAVLLAAFEPHRGSYTAAAFAATTPTAEQVRGRLAEGPVWVAFAGEEADAMVGTVAAVPEGADLYVRSMAVLPEARGCGVGAALLREVERHAALHGHRRLRLSTTPYLLDAIRLYERHGFRRTVDGPHDLAGTPLFTMVRPVDA